MRVEVRSLCVEAFGQRSVMSPDSVSESSTCECEGRSFLEFVTAKYFVYDRWIELRLPFGNVGKFLRFRVFCVLKHVSDNC